MQILNKVGAKMDPRSNWEKVKRWISNLNCTHCSSVWGHHQPNQLTKYTLQLENPLKNTLVYWVKCFAEVDIGCKDSLLKTPLAFNEHKKSWDPVSSWSLWHDSWLRQQLRYKQMILYSDQVDPSKDLRGLLQPSNCYHCSRHLYFSRME